MKVNFRAISSHRYSHTHRGIEHCKTETRNDCVSDTAFLMHSMLMERYPVRIENVSERNRESNPRTTGNSCSSFTSWLQYYIRIPPTGKQMATIVSVSVFSFTGGRVQTLQTDQNESQAEKGFLLRKFRPHYEVGIDSLGCDRSVHRMSEVAFQGLAQAILLLLMPPLLAYHHCTTDSLIVCSCVCSRMHRLLPQLLQAEGGSSLPDGCWRTWENRDPRETFFSSPFFSLLSVFDDDDLNGMGMRAHF